jgi:glycogen phosphorylase
MAPAELEAKIARMSIIQENQWNAGEMMVNMAHLALIYGSFVNGVAAIHSEIIKNQLFSEFAEIFPQKFQNKTNGVTPRRCAAAAVVPAFAPPRQARAAAQPRPARPPSCL